MNKTRIQAVVFDLDDTLYPERLYMQSGYRAVARHLRRVKGRGDRFEDWLWERFLAGSSENAFDALNQHFQLGMGEAGIQELVKIYRDHPPRTRCFDGIITFLGQLRPYYRIGLISDGYMPGQRIKFEALHIEKFFDAVIFTEDMGREFWKPSPAAFDAMSRQLGVPNESCAYIADNPRKDFVGPNSLGWLTIQYIQPGQLHRDNLAPQGGEPKVIARWPGDIWAELVK